MNDLLLIKYFLNKEAYAQYRHLISQELVQGDTGILLNLLDDWYTTHQDDLSIDEFRNVSIGTQILHTHMYPMVNLVNNIEEINDSQFVSDMDFTALNKKKVAFYQNKLKLERKKPTYAKTNLFDIMNLEEKDAL